MEDGLGPSVEWPRAASAGRVLILVLVEDGLGHLGSSCPWPLQEDVLILVLVEDGLGQSARIPKASLSLVLILVLVEDGLGLVFKGIYNSICSVLILVLVEDGLGPPQLKTVTTCGTRLNPCFSGRWSRTICSVFNKLKMMWVLILVLVEDGLGLQIVMPLSPRVYSLNPCFSGRWSRTNPSGGALVGKKLS